MGHDDKASPLPASNDLKLATDDTLDQLERWQGTHPRAAELDAVADDLERIAGKLHAAAIQTRVRAAHVAAVESPPTTDPAPWKDRSVIHLDGDSGPFQSPVAVTAVLPRGAGR